MKNRVDRALGNLTSTKRRALSLSLAVLISASAWSGTVVAEDTLHDVPRNNEVYFTHDSAEIPVSFEALLARHGRFLAENPNLSVRLEGHADMSGARAYNLRLGEHRAQAVRKVLIQYGASPDQFESVSLGEEFRVDESNLSRNRRVVLAYDHLPALYSAIRR